MNASQYKTFQIFGQTLPISETTPLVSIDTISELYGKQKSTSLDIDQIQDLKTHRGIYDDSVHQDMSVFAKTWYEENNTSSLNSSTNSYGGSKWLLKLKERLKELLELPVGWDGYNGLPVSEEIEKTARKLLIDLYQKGIPAPSLVPGSDGSLQMEWHIGQYDLEIDILKPNLIEVYRFDLLSEKDEYFELKSDNSKIVRCISELKRTVSQ